MLLLCYLFFLFPGFSYGDLINYQEGTKAVPSCIKKIIRLYYKEERLTYVDINAGDNEVLKVMNTMTRHLIISRTTAVKYKISHQGYLIYAGNSSDFIANFSNLKKEPSWNPSKRFIIIVKKLYKNQLRDIFNELLVLHVDDVIVINGTSTAEIYTYNAFENYACGRYFERIIEFGQCLNPSMNNPFPNKMITGLENCTFTVAIPHIPPLVIFPSKSPLRSYLPGAEQYAIEIIADREKFNINYSYVDFAETFSMIDGDMKATGYLDLIQKNQTDIIVGAAFLTHTRDAAFEYLYAHLAFTDELTYIVQKAGNVPVWMNMYMEFNIVVWFLIIMSFISSCVLIIILLRIDDKVAIILKLWDNLLLHGNDIEYTSRFIVKLILIIWIWFAYLMNSFYQSSLVSLTTHPSKSYQVSTEKDLLKYKYRPCVIIAIQNFLYSESGMTFKDDIGQCQMLNQGIELVSNTEGFYTISPLSSYQFNRYKFLDSTGTMKVYHFSEPVVKLIYAIFLYKGFPMYKKLHKHSLRLRESGLMDRHFHHLYFRTMLYHQDFDDSFKAHIIVPWNILIVGSTIGTIIFVLEVLYIRMIFT